MDNLSTRTHLVGYSKHSMPFLYDEQRNGLDTYLFRLQTEGTARALVNGKMTEIVAGDLLLYQPGDPYELHVEFPSLRDGKVPVVSSDFYVFCSGAWVDNWWRRTPKPAIIHIPLDDSLVAVWWEFAREQLRMDEFSDEVMDHSLKLLCLKIERTLIGLESDKTTKNAFISYRMRNYIEENVAEPFTVDDVARHVGLSESRTAHLFRQTFQTSIVQYTLDMRLKLAAQKMMFDSAPIEIIAESCGFRSYSYFHRQFKAKFGKSPQEYRRPYR